MNWVAFQILLAKRRASSTLPMENLMFFPCEACVVSQASANRSASAPCLSITSTGSMVFPFTFDIFSPLSSVTIVWK